MFLFGLLSQKQQPTQKLLTNKPDSSIPSTDNPVWTNINLLVTPSLPRTEPSRDLLWREKRGGCTWCANGIRSQPTTRFSTDFLPRASGDHHHHRPPVPGGVQVSRALGFLVHQKRWPRPCCAFPASLGCRHLWCHWQGSGPPAVDTGPWCCLHHRPLDHGCLAQEPNRLAGPDLLC